MKIRYATMDDIPALLDLTRRISAITRFKQFEYSPERLASNIAAVIKDKRGVYCFLVAEDAAGVAVGILLGCLERHVFSDEQLVATLMIYAVLPEKRMGGAGLRLLSAFRQWAENRGAFELNAGFSSGIDFNKTDRFMRKLGFQQTGANYSLMLGKSGQASMDDSPKINTTLCHNSLQGNIHEQ